jgi:predicted unusual protein kinase regulating ubiquinone biosynthesis (AarF/ABC1/UbiB family)
VETAPPQMRTVEFPARRIRALRRSFVWLAVLLRFGAVVCWDWLTRKGGPRRRAVHLRQTLEQRGGLFLKVGQHLAMRLDLLPFEYGIELSRMLDRAAPFPTADAVALVERTTGRPLAETFQRFDPDPVTSTSVACVYQAILHNGDRVVVKVRRPGIGELLMADLKVFDWMARGLELAGVMRSGWTATIRQELRETLLEELNFVQEARYQDLFRRAARKSGKRFFTAPRVHFGLSSEQVLVQEFVAGMWLWELVAAVEQNNRDVLDLAARLNIDPVKIARRLTWINYWAAHEALFFRADPHPDRVIIGQDGRLAFIDFSSAGALSRSKRRALQQNLFYTWKRDPLNMARTSLVLMEPLPAVDVTDLTNQLESANWQMLFALEARRSDRGWCERTSAPQWVGLINQARIHRIPIDSNILRLLRAMILFETLAVRLDPKIDVIKEYRRFARYRAERAERRFERRVLKEAAKPPDRRSLYLYLDRLAKTGGSLLFRLRHALTVPQVRFSALIGQWSYVAYTLIRLGTQILMATLFGAAIAGVVSAGMSGRVIGASEALNRSMASPVLWLIVLVLVLLNARMLLFRLDDKDD